MQSGSIVGLFKLLMFGFGLTGPFSKQEGLLMVPLEENIALAYLRALLTIGTCVDKSYWQLDGRQFDTADLAFQAAEFFRMTAGFDREADSVGQAHVKKAGRTLSALRAEEYHEAKNRAMFGIGDGIVFTLAVFFADSYSSSLDRDEFFELAKSTMEGLIAGHVRRSVYLDSFSGRTISARGEPNWKQVRSGALIQFFDSSLTWSFWREWYQGFLDGKPMDWELQRRVALIEDADWEQGPAHIAGVIEGIRLEFRTSTTPRLVRKTEDGVFEVEDEKALSKDVLEFSCGRIEAALANAMESSGGNGLHSQSYETITIRRALDHHHGRASLLATGFFDACISFQKTIGDRYPDDTALINLKNALYGAVEEINEQHPEARARCARLAQLAQPEPVTLGDREEIALIPERLKSELNGEAREIIESDVEAILANENAPKSVRARFTNWVTTISLWMDKAQKGDKRAKWLASVVSRLVRWWIGADEKGDD